MSHPRPPAGRRCALAALALAALAAPVLWSGHAPAAAQGSPAGRPPGLPGPQVLILAQPTVVGPSDRFPVFVGIENAPGAVELAVDIYDRATATDDIGPVPASDPVATFASVELPEPTDTGPRTSAFAIELFRSGEANPSPAWGHRIDEPGVYPVRIRLRDADENLLATTMTSIIRLPDEGQLVQPTGAALFVRVHRPPPTDAAVRAAGNEADATLLDELDPVLAALAEHPELPATFSVTPDTVARMAADPTAAETLDRLRVELAAADRTLVDAPFVRIDPSELVDAGLTPELSRQRDLGRQTLNTMLEAPTSGTWPLTGPADPATLDALRTRGIFRAVLPDAALRSRAGTTAPVDLPAGDGQVRAIVATDALTVGRAALDDPVLAAHRLLARLAVTATPGSTPLPSDAAAQVVVTIDPTLAEADTLRLVLDTLATGSPFFEITTLDGVLNAPLATAPPRLAPTVPSQIEPLVEQVRAAELALDSYRAMVGGRNEATQPFERTLAISLATDLVLDERIRDAASISGDLQEPFGAISIPERDRITLAARDARFPVPIASTLPYPVEVVVTLQASERVVFPDDRIEVTLPSGGRVVPIDVRTRGLGDTPVQISVRSPDDGVLLAEGQYTIRSTAVSGIGILLTAGAGAFLAIWWGRHWYRNRGTARHARRRRRRTPPPDLAPDV